MAAKIGFIDTYWKFFNQYYDPDILILRGGARSGKSYSIAEWITYLFTDLNDIEMMVIRKTLPSLRITAYALMLDMMDRFQVKYMHNRTYRFIKNKENGNIIHFQSINNPNDVEKIKSWEGNYVWIEEATDLQYSDFQQISLRMSRKNENMAMRQIDGIAKEVKLRNQIYMSFNPIDAFHWIKTEVIDKAGYSFKEHQSSYTNNPYLDEGYIKKLHALENIDKNYYRVYTLGEWGILEGLIYSTDNFVIEQVEFWPKFERPVCYSLDFGFNHPTVLMELYYNDKEFFIKERIYQEGLTTTDLLKMFKNLNIEVGCPIYADPSRTDIIKEISNNGYNIRATPRLKVIDGIDIVKSHKLHIDSNAVNTIDEIRGYKWRKDKNDKFIDEPVKFRDDAMDAIRYGITGFLSEGNIKAPNNPRPYISGSNIPSFSSSKNIPHL